MKHIGDRTLSQSMVGSVCRRACTVQRWLRVVSVNLHVSFVHCWIWRPGNTQQVQSSCSINLQMGPCITKRTKDWILLHRLMFIGNRGWVFTPSVLIWTVDDIINGGPNPACTCLVVIIRDRPLIILPSMKSLQKKSVRLHQKLLRNKPATIINIQDKRFWTCSACGGAAKYTVAQPGQLRLGF